MRVALWTSRPPRVIRLGLGGRPPPPVSFPPHPRRGAAPALAPDRSPGEAIAEASPLSQPIVLYGPRRTPYTEKVRRALVLKGLDFELCEPSGPEDYRRWSPETGLLPVLAIGQERVADSTRILLRLDELWPKPPLLSPDPVVAAQQRQLEDWADESFLWYWNRWLALVRRRTSESPPPRRAWLRVPGVRQALAWLRAGGSWERPETALLRGIDDRLADLVNLLGTRRFFYADQPSIADFGVYGMLFVLRMDAMLGSARLVASRPSLIEFMRRLEEATGG